MIQKIGFQNVKNTQKENKSLERSKSKRKSMKIHPFQKN